MTEVAALALLFPAKARCSARGIEITFVRISPGHFQDPFCHETILRCNDNLWVTKSFSWPQIAEVSPSMMEPSGLIFHIARCGSTLVSQLLKALPSLVVYSEPPVLNDVLMSSGLSSMQQRVGA